MCSLYSLSASGTARSYQRLSPVAAPTRAHLYTIPGVIASITMAVAAFLEQL
jgi:hypothetical protein